MAGFITTYHPCLKISHLIHKSQSMPGIWQRLPNSKRLEGRGLRNHQTFATYLWCFLDTYTAKPSFLRLKITSCTFFLPEFASHSPSRCILQLWRHIQNCSRVPDGWRITGPRVGGGSQCCGLFFGTVCQPMHPPVWSFVGWDPVEGLNQLPCLIVFLEWTFLFLDFCWV